MGLSLCVIEVIVLVQIDKRPTSPHLFERVSVA
jgi:hypothetical protein